jgi:hypothetical protein
VTVAGTGTEPGAVRVNVVPVIVAAFIASLNVTETFVLRGTSLADAVGIVETTVGATSAFAVVNVHVLAVAKGVPATSWTPVVTVAVYTVFDASEEVGLRTATSLA